MNVAVFSQKVGKKEISFLKRFFQELNRLNWTPIIEENYLSQLKSVLHWTKNYPTFKSHLDFLNGIDLIISIGGDGTFLKTVKYVQSSNVPILGINTGRLGFLADINVHDFELILDRIQQNDYLLQKRSLISVTTEDDIFGNDNLALNEVAAHKKDTASMITIEAYLDDVYLNSYWADGLLVGTPTGSTAYNLSCGGPIISPGSGVYFITPIAAHNLNVRPVIVPDNQAVTLKGVGRSRNFLLSLDSVSKTVRTGSLIKIKKSDFSIRLIKSKENDFFTTIREKMLWGIDQRNE